VPRVALVVVLVMLGAGLVAGVVQLASRVEVEQASRSVAVVLDYDELARVAAQGQTTPEEILRRMGDAVSHVAVAEQTWDDLAAAGAVQTFGPTAVPYGYVPPGFTVLHITNWSRGQEMVAALKAKGFQVEPPKGADGKAFFPASVGRSLLVPTALVEARDLGLGYDAGVVERLRRAGVGIVARPRPALVSTPQAVRGSLELARATGASVVIFLGNEVLGNPAAVGATAETLKALDLKFGWVELSPQFGAERLAHATADRLLRTHSIGELEMHKLTAQQATDRYLRAVRERGVRVLYVRLLPTVASGADPVEANVQFARGLAEKLGTEGFRVGEPSLLRPLEVPLPLRLMIALAPVAVMLLACLALGVSWSSACWLLVIALGLLLAAAGAASDLARDALALLGVVSAASVGLLFIKPREPGPRQPLLTAVGHLIVLSLVTLALASLAAALLSDRLHMLGIELFRGVKLSLLLPPLVVLVVQAARSTRSYWEVQTEAGGSQEGTALLAGLRELAEAAVKYWHVVLAMVLLAVAALMIVRSGNEPLFGLSGAEMKARAALEHFMGVRPRTKEFVVGHPLLLLGLWLLYRGRRRGVWLLLAGGAIGQASLANTFCHLHSPYLLGVQRGLVGLGCGVVLGLLGVAVWAAVEACLQRRAAARSR